MKTFMSFRALIVSTALVLLIGIALLTHARAKNPNEHEIKPAPNVLDPDELYNKAGELKDGKLWALDFKFKSLRSIKVNIPGRGERICWYLWYQVANKTKKPHFFIPNFELVTQDTNAPAYRDEILPKVQDAIIEREDPKGVLNIKNSITMFKEPIPPSQENAIPKWVTGVAIWTDPNEPMPTDTDEEKKRKAKAPKLSESNFFSIFVAGLSNGWAETDPLPGETEPVIRRKTLQISFRRFGDGALRRDSDIRYIKHRWIYRASSLKIPKD